MTISLMPDRRHGGPRLPDPAALRLLAMLAVCVIAVWGVQHHESGKRAAAQATYNDANAKADTLALQTSRLKEQLGALEGAGGTNRIELVRNLLASRAEWKKVLLAVARSSRPGITIGGFAASAPNTATAPPVTLDVTARDRGQMRSFVDQLRAHKDVFSDVTLGRVSIGGDDEGQNTVGVTFTVNVTLKTLPPAPGAPTAAPTETNASSGAPAATGGTP